jgi:hypothetical protein
MGFAHPEFEVTDVDDPVFEGSLLVQIRLKSSIGKLSTGLARHSSARSESCHRVLKPVMLGGLRAWLQSLAGKS